MDKRKGMLGYFIITSAIIWGLAIVTCALKLKGSGAFAEISYILSLAAIIHFILIWGPLAALLRKERDDENGNTKK